MLIAKITESDFFGGEPQYIDDYASYNTRGYLGWIEEHKFKRKFCMVSHCYVAKKVSDKCDTAMLERSQERLGYKIEWMPYDEAVSRLKALSEQCKEYQMSFVLKREQLILEKAKEYIVK